jgi:hypothetical protein
MEGHPGVHTLLLGCAKKEKKEKRGKAALEHA